MVTYDDIDNALDIIDQDILAEPIYDPQIEEIDDLIRNEEDFEKFYPYLLALSNKENNSLIVKKVNELIDKYVVDAIEEDEEEINELKDSIQDVKGEDIDE